jgi:hypothetical protein
MTALVGYALLLLVTRSLANAQAAAVSLESGWKKQIFRALVLNLGSRISEYPIRSEIGIRLLAVVIKSSFLCKLTSWEICLRQSAHLVLQACFRTRSWTFSDCGRFSLLFLCRFVQGNRKNWRIPLPGTGIHFYYTTVLFKLLWVSLNSQNNFSRDAFFEKIEGFTKYC